MSSNLQEIRETEMYDALLKDARTVNVNDEKNCDELLENIETQYRIGTISEEMVRYITGIICSR